MDVRITTRHTELSKTFREMAEERIRKLGKYEPRLIAVDLLFEEDHGKLATEARADVPGQPPMVARGNAADRRASLDQAITRLSRQLRRSRSKRVDHQAEPAALEIGD